MCSNSFSAILPFITTDARECILSAEPIALRMAAVIQLKINRATIDSRIV